MYASNEGRQRYVQLQKDWEEAFQQFETATDEFATAVHTVKDHLEKPKE
jgi:hypothetical protein